MRYFHLTLVLLLTQSLLFSQKKYSPNWESLDSRPTPEWWLDAKFGIFIHWGVYAVPGWCTKGNYGEWYQYGLQTTDTARQAYHRQRFGDSTTYYELAPLFKAELYRPDEWAQLFEKAGAKYVVLTSKHHDGYCLWPSAEANKIWGFPWNSVDCEPHRDLLGELFTALRKTSVRPGLYYSLFEWFNPVCKNDKPRYVRELMLPQLNDLVNRYQPAVVWADGDWDAKPEDWQTPEWLAWLYNESPVRDSVVVNDRWGTGVRFNHAGIYTPEYQPDIEFENHAWEESRGMAYSYGFNREEDAWDYCSSQTLLLHLADKVARGGNFLLDIGPDEHGKIPPIMQERLLDIGAWLKINGEAIYDTRRWEKTVQWSAGRRDFKPELIDGWKTGGDALLTQTLNPPEGYASKQIFYTWKPEQNTLYAIIPRYPIDNQLVMKDIAISKKAKITFLETGEKLKWRKKGADISVSMPDFHPEKIKSKHLWVVKIENF